VNQPGRKQIKILTDRKFPFLDMNPPKIYALFMALMMPIALFGQERSRACGQLDETAFDSWTSVGGSAISNNGQYVCYGITASNHPYKFTLVVKSLAEKWEMEFPQASSISFQSDNSQLIFKQGKDSLMTLDLKLRKIRLLDRCVSYNLSEGEANWIAYRPITKPKQLVLLDLKTGAKLFIANAGSYVFGSDHNIAIQDFDDGNKTFNLKLINLGTKPEVANFYSDTVGGKLQHLVFDADSKQIAFMIQRTFEGKIISDVWNYKYGSRNALKLTDGISKLESDGTLIAPEKLTFSNDGNYLLVNVFNASKNVNASLTKQPDIWSYSNPVLQPINAQPENNSPHFLSAINVFTNHTVQIESTRERVIGMSSSHVLLENGVIGNRESYWNTNSKYSFCLLSLETGIRLPIEQDVKLSSEAQGIDLSPTGKWVIYFDAVRKDFFTYETKTGLRRNITEKCNTHWVQNEGEYPDPTSTQMGYAKWSENDDEIVISDGYDIWEIDPACGKAPVDLTNGYGFKNQIKFQLVPGDMLKNRSSVLVSAVDQRTKDRGFFKIIMDRVADPQKCTLGPFVFGDWGGHGYENDFDIQKASNSDIWIIKRSSASDAPNYFLTKNLKDFVKISDVAPQKRCNWLTTELVSWKTPGGNISDGILYKPMDFDPSKKYPVIFTYYETHSDELNLYLQPGQSDGDLNIPWFVSRDYLVFVPDIHYKTGDPGISALNSVTSAARYLSKRDYVDSTKMGLEGLSFGGYETNCIIAGSHMFAAACSASGVSDLAGLFGSASRGDYQFYWAEKNQGRLGILPWQDPDTYIRNSPIYHVANITTPLLLMANHADDVVHFDQGMELFAAMRRAGKKVWLLQYDDGDHTVNGKSGIDFNNRMTQFFDHYLKNAPAPDWISNNAN
jgi:dienelactone hydrolase